MENIVFTSILIIIIGLAAFYVIRAKKKGRKCIGCSEEICPHRQKGISCCSCGENLSNDAN